MTRRTHSEYASHQQVDDLRDELRELASIVEASNNMTRILSGTIPCSCDHECTRDWPANISHGLIKCCYNPNVIPGCMGEGVGVCMSYADCGENW